MDRESLRRRATTGLVQLGIVMGLCLFLPAWTLAYWQAWLFLGVFLASCAAINQYLLAHDPALLERRLHGTEQEARQKVFRAFAGVVFIATLVVPALDHRFGWAPVPLAAVLVGDALVALGFWVVYRVFRENSFASSVIEVDAGQRVVASGPYAVVRHPMYAGALLLFLGTPLALGSAAGLAVFVPALLALVFRLLNEEAFLREHLAGYEAYCAQTRHHLLPGLW